jgi:segregation and condensation protein B
MAPKQGGSSRILCRLWDFLVVSLHQESIRPSQDGSRHKELSRAEAGVLMAIAYFQPVTRGEISEMFRREISRDLIASLRAA